MASRLNLSSVVHSVEGNKDDLSDWDLSEDELVGAGEEGAVDDPLRSLMSPLDKLDASTDEIPKDDTPASSNTVVGEGSLLGSDETLKDMQSVQTSSPHPVQSTTPADHFDHPPFTRPNGSQLPLTEHDEPHEFFEAIFDLDSFDHIADQTTLYASQSGATLEPTSAVEIKAFIGILLAMGVHRLPHLHDYWNQHPLLGAPGLTHSMPRDRFKQILMYLHINDNTQAKPHNDSQYDKLHKIRPLLNKIRDNTQKAYMPHQQLSIDEAMVLFKGRSSLKQFMPLKPIKRGYKIWCICDAVNGLAYDEEVYLGAAGSSGEGSLGKRVVMHVIQKVTGHEVYMDNFFSSRALSLALRECQTFMIGPAQVNRKGFPESLRDTKAFAKTVARGEHRSVLTHDGKTECLMWMDNKPVALNHTANHYGHSQADSKGRVEEHYPLPTEHQAVQYVHGWSRLI